MNRYKLTISYDGTSYYGWQVQPTLPSVAQTLQDTFLRVFGEDVVVLGASRTDAGVHARGQVALVRTLLAIDPKRLHHAWNNALPSSIHIQALETVSEDFHPFYNSAYKTYHYHWVTQRPSPFIAPRVWQVMATIDREKLKRTLHVFIGTHDFTAFCTDEDAHKDTVCTIYEIGIEQDDTLGAFRIVVRGNRFLRHMVRRMVGAAIKVASVPDLDESCIQEALNGNNRTIALPTAPAQGLILHEIVYKN